MDAVRKKARITPMDNLTVLVPVLIAIIMSVPGILQLRRQVKGDAADVAMKYQELLSKQIGRCEILEATVETLEKKLDALEAETKRAQWRIKRLEAQLISAGIEPVEE